MWRQIQHEALKAFLPYRASLFVKEIAQESKYGEPAVRKWMKSLEAWGLVQMMPEFSTLYTITPAGRKVGGSVYVSSFELRLLRAMSHFTEPVPIGRIHQQDPAFPKKPESLRKYLIDFERRGLAWSRTGYYQEEFHKVYLPATKGREILKAYAEVNFE